MSIGDGVPNVVAPEIIIEFVDEELKTIKLATNDSCQFIRPLILVEKQRSLNGLIKYQWDVRDMDSKSIDFWDKVLKNTIYHFFKLLFHDHVFCHEKEDDAYLCAYKTNDDIDISAENNDALNHYLHNFEFNFINYSDTILKKRNKREYFRTVRPKAWIKNLWAAHYLIEEQCNKILGMVLYYNVLLQSWNSVNSSVEDAQCRINAQNAIDAIRRLQIENKHQLLIHQNRITFNMLTQKVSQLQKATSVVGKNVNITKTSVNAVNENVDTTKRSIDTIDKIVKSSDESIKKSKTTNIISIVLGSISIILGIISLVVAFKSCK